MTIKKASLAITILLGTFAASSAPAFAGEFEAEAAWSAEGGPQIYKLAEGAVAGECRKITVIGVSPKSKASATALLKPSYTECTATIGSTKSRVVVETGECEYELHNLKGESSYSAEANLVNCSGGIVVKAASGLCTVTIPEQSNTKAGTGSNLKTAKGSFESEATADLIGFKFTAKGTCGFKSGTDGEYTGKAIAKGLIAN